MRAAVLCLIAACAPAARDHGIDGIDGPLEAPASQTRHYTIWLGAARVGTTIERERWTPAGLLLRRDERLAFLRDGAPVTLWTTLEIETDPDLVPYRVTWTEHGIEPRRREARRVGSTWQLEPAMAGTPLATDAIPVELLALRIRRDRAFAGPVFLPARGFARGHGQAANIAPDRYAARVTLDTGLVVEATIDLDADRTPARIVDGEGVIARRATLAETAALFDPIDLVAATSIPLSGSPGRRVALSTDLQLPALPGQRSVVADATVVVELAATLPSGLPPPAARARGRDRARDVDHSAVIAGLVDRVRAQIVPDLSARIATYGDAATARAGDCTTFALAYAALASQHEIPTRIVTGFRVDHDRLVRHRWAVSWTGRRWIAVDAALGRAHAGGDLIGLAVHDVDDVGLASGEVALARVHGARWIE